MYSDNPSDKTVGLSSVIVIG